MWDRAAYKSGRRVLPLAPSLAPGGQRPLRRSPGRPKAGIIAESHSPWGTSFMSAQAPTTRLCVALSIAAGMLLASCGGGADSSMKATDPAVTTQPSNQTVAAGQTATFSVVATGTAPLSYQWQKGTSDIAGATSTNYTTPTTGIADSGSTFRVLVSNSAGSATSNAATLTVNSVSTTTDVLTYHNDSARTGQNLTESTLTTSNVTSATFGKIGFYPVDGKVDAQPLYASNVTVPGKSTHNVLIVPTEHDSVYGFDADSGTILWQTSMLANGETPSDPRGCGQVSPEIGVTATPVIDRTRDSNGPVYVAAM